MADQKDDKGITAVVPAYNEAERIGDVLEALVAYPHFQEIIVVDDGSADGTETVVRNFPVRYVRNDKNCGKGHAMDRGVSLANGKIIFFCDADIRGLSVQVIDEIVRPVRTGEVDMFIGMRNRKWYFAHQILAFIPLLGGERAIAKALWQKLPDHYKQYFRIEAALNFYALYHGRGFQYKVFKGLSQVIKERKYGFWRGTKQRWGMIGDILGTQWRLHALDMPAAAKKNRRLSQFIYGFAYKARNNKT